jgi:acylphosphatase
MEKRLVIKVSGRVQGVFYRASTRDMAERLGLKGFVRNEPDGAVYIEVEGDEAILAQFASWCTHGPELAKVDAINVNEVPLVGFTKFEVRR